MLGVPSNCCCSFVTTSSPFVQGQDEYPATPDLVFGPVATVPTAKRPPPNIPNFPRLLAPALSAVPLYLLIGHLLR